MRVYSIHFFFQKYYETQKIFNIKLPFCFGNLCFAQSHLAQKIDSLFTSYLDSNLSGSVISDSVCYLGGHTIKPKL